MKIIETPNGVYVQGTSSILKAQAHVMQEQISGPLLFAQVLSSEGVPYVWLSTKPGAPDDLPEDGQ